MRSDLGRTQKCIDFINSYYAGSARFFPLSGEHLPSVLLVLLFLSILPLLFRPEQRNTHLELIIKRVSEVTSIKFEPYLRERIASKKNQLFK